MPHDEACENATEPECHCSCGGQLHGTKAGRPSAPRMGESQIFDSSTLSQDEWARQASGESKPWQHYGLTESQWNHKGTDGTTLGDAIMDAEEDPRNEGEKVVFKYWSKDKGERVPIAYMEDPKNPDMRHPIWDTPLKKR